MRIKSETGHCSKMQPCHAPDLACLICLQVHMMQPWWEVQSLHVPEYSLLHACLSPRYMHGSKWQVESLLLAGLKPNKHEHMLIINWLEWFVWTKEMMWIDCTNMHDVWSWSNEQLNYNWLLHGMSSHFHHSLFPGFVRTECWWCLELSSSEVHYGSSRTFPGILNCVWLLWRKMRALNAI